MAFLTITDVNRALLVSYVLSTIINLLQTLYSASPFIRSIYNTSLLAVFPSLDFDLSRYIVAFITTVV